MSKKRKRKEFVVDAPSLKRREAKLLKDTTGAEARDVFKVSRKMGRRLSNLMIMVGALLSIFTLYGILTSAQSLFSNSIFIASLGFLGALNIFCGLILLAKE